MISSDVPSQGTTGSFDAIDWGCSSGGSIEFVRHWFNVERILGIDLDPRKVTATRAKGYDVLQADAATIDLPDDWVSASYMFHFLEHLPDRHVAFDIIRNACRITSRYLLIRQPYFGADEQLFHCGLKTSWSTWRGHPNKMGALEFHTVLEQLLGAGAIRSYRIGYAYPILDSHNEAILPLSAGPEELRYDGARHEAKPLVELRDVYREICVLACKSQDVEIADIERAARVERWICEAGRPAP